MPEQRKIITALFCDLVGSTELSGILEPETLRSVTLRYFETMRGSIETHGGTVEKFIGDAVMAVFGFPVMHEDDAHRAATAALDMIASLAALNTDLEQEVGSTLTVRIGLNTGVAVTSAEATSEAMVSGEVVNVAARLEGRAEPGHILIGPTTRTLLGPSAVVEPVGALALKGKRDPVDAFRLIGLVSEGPHHERRFDTPFVGRERELAVLTAAWAGAQDGRAGCPVEVIGEAGIGKTRLLREWLTRCAADGALEGVGRCHPYRDTASLAPLADAMRQLLDAAARLRPVSEPEPDGPAYEMLREGLLADGTPSPSTESTYAAVATVLSDLATTRPVALVLDDCQWARPLLLDAVGRMRGALAGTRVMLVCSGRPVDGRTGPPGSVGIRLGPLSSADSHRLAAHLVRTQPYGVTSLNAVVERAEGNPLHLAQLLMMYGRGADPDELPATVTAVLAARIDTLDAAERTMLDAGAVVGRSFDLNLARYMLETAELDRCLASLSRLVRRGLVEPVPGSATCYQFGTGLLHEVTYRGISKRRRAQWHERLADAPEIGPASATHHIERAYLYRSGLGLRGARTEALRGRAARALTETGRHALARADLSWSGELHRRALALSGKDDPWWTKAAQGLGETWLAIGRSDEGTALLKEVMSTASKSGDRLAYAHARLHLASPDAGLDSAAEAARAGLELFRASGDQLGLARAHIRLAQEQQFKGQHRAASELLTSALNHAVAAGAVPERAMALGALGISLWHGPTPAAAAVRRCRELLAEHSPGNPVVVVTLNYPLANLLALRGEIKEARACLARADRFASELGYAEVVGVAPMFAAGVEVLAGALQAAERLLLDAVERCRSIGTPTLLATASRDLARVLLDRGKRPAPELLGRDGTGLPPAEAADHFGVRALAQAAEGNATAALVLARRAVAEAGLTDSPITRATAELDLARTHATAGRPAEAHRAADRAAHWFMAKGHIVGRKAALALSAAEEKLGGP